MKTYCNLPDYIQLPDGAILKPVIGGHLDQKPFLPVALENGWGNKYHEWEINEMIFEEAKTRKLKARKVSVLSRQLKGKRDLHGLLYKPTIWIFVQVNEPARIIKEYTPRR